MHVELSLSCPAQVGFGHQGADLVGQANGLVSRHQPQGLLPPHLGRWESPCTAERGPRLAFGGQGDAVTQNVEQLDGLEPNVLADPADEQVLPGVYVDFVDD